MRQIHVGILVSYDYQYLPLCIAQIYEKADKITLAIDKNRKSWAGEEFYFDEEFLANILRNDPKKKISVYEDNFSIPELPSWKCDHRERLMLREYMNSEAEDAWHLQLDTDEYFIDFDGFVKYLHQIEKDYTGKITVYCKLITIFKCLPDGIIIAEDNEGLGYFPVASIGGCRFEPAENEIKLKTNFKVLHQSWGRSEEEIGFKIKSWGHNKDFNTNDYLKFWKSVNQYNAEYIKDCHPLGKSCGWNHLVFYEGSIKKIITDIKQSECSYIYNKSIIRKAKLSKTIQNIKKSKVGNSLRRIKNVFSKH